MRLRFIASLYHINDHHGVRPMHMYMHDPIKSGSNGFRNRNVYIFRLAPKLFSVHFQCILLCNENTKGALGSAIAIKLGPERVQE